MWWNMFILGKGPQKAKRWRKKSPVAGRRGNCALIPRFSLDLPPVIRNAWIGPTFTHLQFSQPIRMESFPKFQFSPVQSIGGAGFFYNRLKYGCIIGIFSDVNAQDLNPISCSVQFSSVTQSCPTLCDPMNCSTPGLPVHHQLPEFTQTHAHRVRDAIQPPHPLSPPSPPAPNPSQHQGLFQ